MKLKKIIKKPGKNIPKLGEELSEEIADFFKLVRKGKVKKLRKVYLYGSLIAVRPAYILAERVENILKMIFGFSILISAIIAAGWGFTRLAILLDVLISSWAGRIILIIIGLSYLVIGMWKMGNIKF